MRQLLFCHWLQVLKIFLSDHAPRLVSPGHQCAPVVAAESAEFWGATICWACQPACRGEPAKADWVLLTICDVPLHFCFLRTDSAYQGDQGPPKTTSSPTAQQAPRSAVPVVHEAVAARQAAPLFVEKFPLLLPWIWWPVSKLLFFPCNIGSLLWSLHFDPY